MGNLGQIIGLLPAAYWPFPTLVAQMVKRLPTMQETQVQSLRREGPLEKEMATYSSTLAWKIPWTEEHGRLQSMGLQRVEHELATEQQQKLSDREINDDKTWQDLYLQEASH